MWNFAFCFRLGEVVDPLSPFVSHTKPTKSTKLLRAFLGSLFSFQSLFVNFVPFV